MPTSKTAPKRRSNTARTPHRKTSSARRTPRSQDAVAMLREDHARVDAMFERFENLRGNDRKQKLVEEICAELVIHTQLEEEIFYPAVREAIGAEDLMDEAVVEHQSAKDLIAQLQGMSPDEPLYDAKVTVLGEYIKHHVKEEHTEMFPKAKRSGVDLVELGERMRTRKQAISGGVVAKLKQMLR